MGCSDIKIEEYSINSKINDKYIFFHAYESIKQVLIQIKFFKQISFSAYLISTNSIPKFINYIKTLNILEYIDKKKEIEEIENELNSLLRNYKLEKNIKILYNYNDCLNIMKNNKNEFIIVDELFCKSMDIENYFESEKTVKIIIDENKFIYKVKFSSNDELCFGEQKTGFYRFLNIKIDE